jgi:hypothetical protein
MYIMPPGPSQGLTSQIPPTSNTNITGPQLLCFIDFITYLLKFFLLVMSDIQITAKGK